MSRRFHAGVILLRYQRTVGLFAPSRWITPRMAEAVMELGAKNNITLLCASLSLKDIAYLSSSAIRREIQKPNESEVENFTRGFLSSRGAMALYRAGEGDV